MATALANPCSSLSFLSLVPANERSLTGSRIPASPEKLPGSWYGIRQREMNVGPKLVVKSKKRMFDDPFDYGADPGMIGGDLYATGKQDPVDPRPPLDETSDRGWLKFPPGHNPEIASLGLYIRNDVRSCGIMVSGGVYENLLFFPVIQMLKEKYPGVRIDVASNARGKQSYEINKNVRRAWVYDVADPFVVPGEYTEFLGKLKSECYDMVMSTRLAGMGHAMFLFMTDSRQRISYVVPNANGAGAGVFLTHALRVDTLNLAERGYHMYSDLAAFLSTPTNADVAPISVPPLEVNIPKKVQIVTRQNYEAAGLRVGSPFILVHGIESTSAASMRSQGDADSQLSLDVLNEIARNSTLPLLVVIPNEREREKVLSVAPNAHVVKITTPGQLAAAIDDSSAVVSSNTAALPLSFALRKRSIALFGSAEKASLYVPREASECVVLSSKTGLLDGIDLKALSVALSTLPVPTLA